MPDALRIPQPLTSLEIKEGVANMIAAAVNATDEVKRSIRLSLDRTCSLNAVSYSKFKVEWTFTRDRLGCEWMVNYELDDFGRPVIGRIGGSSGYMPSKDVDKTSGTIPEMPPDAFRRQTQQKIPAPTVMKPNPDANQPGVTKSWRQTGRGKKTA